MKPVEGWRVSTLSNVCEVGPRDSALQSSAMFVPMDSVQIGRRWPKYYEARGNRSGIRARDNDVLFARITPCLENGKLAQVPIGMGAVGGSTEFIVLRPGPKLDPGFLYYWCLEPSVRADAQSMMAGATGRMRLAGKQLAAFEIPVPALCEQRRIVDILEDHLSRLDAAERSLASATQRLGSLRATSYEQVFRSATGRRTTLGDVAMWGSGGTPKTSEPSYYGGSIPWVVSGDLKDGPLYDVAGRISADGLRASSAKWVPANAVLVAMYGATIGKAAITTQAVTTNQAVAHAVPLHEAVSSDYLFWFLLSQRHWLVRAGQGGAQPNISQTVLKGWPIVIPSAADQEDAVARLASLSEGIDRQLAELHKVSRRGRLVRRALLEAAFSGRLTPRTSDNDLDGLVPAI